MVLSVRGKDQAMERYLAPRSANSPVSPSGPLQELIVAESEIMESKNRLVDLWTAFQTKRLDFDRLMGALPYNDWGDFFQQFNRSQQFNAPATVPAAGPGGPELQPAVPQARPEGR